ncbi:sensor histidine kinase [Uliginosibacterium aquaticum]|uniref:histidine kinase n=1 Tax=Uliginosibacterium aquaticum TaxID=2731212 RepID=A0ABX2IKI6_9RHOO|nr:HAMP domain-containing sensor histidine kinase [Uliginosibacterium aquaticum]NSL54570.1 HAMP domain-containing histidine kinase [Uliginosibacterium aquaticum]
MIKIPALRLRAKLVLIFVAIKVLPLVLLAALAWSAAHRLGHALGQRAAVMADNMAGSIREVGDKATQDAIVALDDRSREAIERLTTDTALAVAAFLHERDRDLQAAALLEPNEAGYRNFLRHRTRDYYRHGEWRLKADGSGWEPAVPHSPDPASIARAGEALPDNAKSFHARPPEYRGERSERPLYLEMSFIGLDGQEKLRIVDGEVMRPGLRNVSRRENTFVRAETFWPELRRLRPGEIYVSEVIGAYVGSHVIGPYTPQAAEKAGIAFEPQKSAYAGTENPLGQRFRGIVRWAMPVVRSGRITGYVSLALDHDHLRQFTERILPTEARYTPIIDAIGGNYAFMWDHKSRAIAHPRDYMIVGYDPASGEQVPPWMDEELYVEWKGSGKSWAEFSADIPPFRDQSLKRKPAAALLAAGTLGLDCRYLNFSPQCAGWNQLTAQGGSGSFEIFFTGLQKLTTAAAIPYYTGQYGDSARGFGFITIGANVDDFHRAATDSARQIGLTIEQKNEAFRQERQDMLQMVENSMQRMTVELAGSTFVMVVLVIGIAFWMASFLAGHIGALVEGIRRFASGDRKQRFDVRSRDEMGDLARALNSMAETVDDSFLRSEEARQRAEDASRMKSDFLASVSHELRTPLNGILGFADLLAMDLKDVEQREQALTIRNSGKHLLGVVNDLLDLAKIESGKMTVHAEPIDLPAFVADVVRGHRAHAAGKGLELLLEMARQGPLPVLESDALRLRQILNNLINNAIKYTDHGQVSVQLEAEGTDLVFQVRDTGCGIAAEDQEAIFDRFGGVGSKVQRDKGGSGLGLSLVRKLAGLLGGRVSLASEPGRGSLFTLRIPQQPRADEGIPGDGAGPEPSGSDSDK